MYGVLYQGLKEESNMGSDGRRQGQSFGNCDALPWQLPHGLCPRSRVC